MDVVVVGAGAAGIAAARTALGAGLETVVVEASARIGGRAFTDHTTFGVPFDRAVTGCTRRASIPWSPRPRAGV